MCEPCSPIATAPSRNGGLKPVVDHIPESVAAFLESFAPADAAGTVGEALLAVALGSGSADNRKRAKDLIKRSNQKRRVGALKALSRRVYDNHHSALVASPARPRRAPPTPRPWRA